MLSKKYKVNPNITKEELLEYGFCETKDGYLLRVSAYRYKKKTTLLYLNFLVTYKDNTPQMIVDCKNNDGKWYIPFYNPTYNKNNVVLKTVNKELRLTISDLAKHEIVQSKLKHTKQKETK